MVNRRQILKLASFVPFFITPNFNINKKETIDENEIFSYKIETTFNLEAVLCSGLSPYNFDEIKGLTTITIQYKNRKCIYKTYNKILYPSIKNTFPDIKISSESFLQNAEIMVIYNGCKCIMSDCKLVSITYQEKD